MLKRSFDILIAVIGLVVFSPVLLLTAIFIKLDSNGPVFFLQERVGLNGKLFKIHKFRTMYVQANLGSNLTKDNISDPRITRVGRYIRKFHLDEAIQLLDVLQGNMSIVGPRPEVVEYTKHYPELWSNILSVKPGITGLSSLKYSRKEYSILSQAKDPREAYIKVVLPKKLKLESFYIKHQSLLFDINVIFKTLLLILQIKTKN
jgi:lipopolysaccharide/colanic/teichoic acid biosynthesis glycosyltransferase